METEVTVAEPTRDENVDKQSRIGYWPEVGQPASPSESEVDPMQILAFREDQMEILDLRKHDIEQRIRGLETGYMQRNNDAGQL